MNGHSNLTVIIKDAVDKGMKLEVINLIRTTVINKKTLFLFIAIIISLNFYTQNVFSDEVAPPFKEKDGEKYKQQNGIAVATSHWDGSTYTGELYSFSQVLCGPLMGSGKAWAFSKLKKEISISDTNKYKISLNFDFKGICGVASKNSFPEFTVTEAVSIAILKASIKDLNTDQYVYQSADKEIYNKVIFLTGEDVQEISGSEKIVAEDLFLETGHNYEICGEIQTWVQVFNIPIDPMDLFSQTEAIAIFAPVTGIYWIGDESVPSDYDGYCRLNVHIDSDLIRMTRLEMDQNSYNTGDTAILYVSLQDYSGSPLEGATVSYKVKDKNNITVKNGLCLDKEDGNYESTFKVDDLGKLGSFRVEVTASKTNYSDAKGTTTFDVVDPSLGHNLSLDFFSSSQSSYEPGDTASFSLQITNRGNYSEDVTATLTITGPNGFFDIVEEEKGRLDPNHSTGQFLMYWFIPSNSEYGVYTVEARASSLSGDEDYSDNKKFVNIGVYEQPSGLIHGAYVYTNKALLWDENYQIPGWNYKGAWHEIWNAPDGHSYKVEIGAYSYSSGTLLLGMNVYKDGQILPPGPCLSGGTVNCWSRSNHSHYYDNYNLMIFKFHEFQTPDGKKAFFISMAVPTSSVNLSPLVQWTKVGQSINYQANVTSQTYDYPEIWLCNSNEQPNLLNDEILSFFDCPDHPKGPFSIMATPTSINQGCNFAVIAEGDPNNYVLFGKLLVEHSYDAKVSQITINPPSPRSGSIVKITSTVENIGSAFLTGIEVYALVTGPDGYIESFSSEANGGDVEFDWDTLGCFAGIYTITASISHPNDSNDSNNSLSETFYIGPSPFLSVIANTDKNSYCTEEIVNLSIIVNDDSGLPISGASVIYSVLKDSTEIISGPATDLNSGNYAAVFNAPVTPFDYKIQVLANYPRFVYGQTEKNLPVKDCAAPSVTLLSPNGGETFLSNETYSIIWSANDNIGISHIKIEYSVDGGANYVPIVDSAPNTGSFPWTVPAIASDNCIVKVTASDYAENFAFDGSENSFTVIISGQLQVEISPQEAVDAGAQWKVTTESNWHNSGETIFYIPAIYTLEFKPVSGWSKPLDKQINIAINETTFETGTYEKINIVPEINVKKDLNNIPDEGTYNFGECQVVTDIDVEFTIENTGTADLTLSGSPIITIIGANADQFSVQQQPSSTVTPNDYTTFIINFNPMSEGTKKASISIANNDSDENPYDIILEGIGIAPAGFKVAFTSDREGPDQRTQLWAIDSDKSGLAQLTDFSSPWRVLNIISSNDGDWIAFQKADDLSKHRAEIWKIGFDGSNLSVINDPGPAINGNCAPQNWSPDDNLILFSSEQSNHNGWYKLWKVDSDGSNPQLCDDYGNAPLGEFSLDGIQIVYANSQDYNRPSSISIMNTMCSDKQLILGADQWPSNYGPLDNIVWLNSGEIIFSIGPYGGNYDIYKMNSDGTGLQELINNNGDDKFGRFRRKGKDNISSDGSKFLFYSNESGNYDVYIANIDGTGLQQLTTDSNEDKFPAFSPNGSKIIWVSNRSGTYSIWVMDVDGTDKEQLTDDSGNETDFTISRSQSNVVWYDGFEEYESGAWPSSHWIKDANADDSANNYVDDTNFQGGVQSLKLYGVINSYWAALAFRALNASPPFYIETWIMNGTEQPTSGHTNKANINLVKGTSWTNPGRGLLVSKLNGELLGVDGTVIGTYTPGLWFRLLMKYEVNGLDTNVSYWIDGEYKGRYTVSAIPEEIDFQLDYLALTAQGGSAWYDDVKIYSYYAVESQPFISEISPTSGPPGTEVTINGFNFGADEGTVTFNGESSSIFSWTNTQIVSEVPTGVSTGQVAVLVHTNDGRQSNEEMFIVCVIPVINTHPQSQTIPYDTSTSLSVDASDSEPLSYQWYRGDSGDTTNPVGDNSSSFPTPNLIEMTSYWVRVSNDCGYVDSDTATITVIIPHPEIDIKHETTDIFDGEVFDFGTQEVGTHKEVAFTIENTGLSSLELNGTPVVNISGADAEQFSVEQEPVSPVAAGESTTFVIRFHPASVGIKTASLSIANNDSDENPYDINITGTGVSPEINVKQGDSNIPDGGEFDFGTNTDVDFTIENIGTSDLTLSGSPIISVSGANADQFIVGKQPASLIASGNSTAFIIRFSPTSEGLKTASISIANNDSDENPYDITLTGNGTAPEINIKKDDTDIPEGGSFDFSLHKVGTDTDATFTIENTGTADLALGGSPVITISGADADQFSVEQQPASPITQGNSTTFIIRFSPGSEGLKTASISIANNDSDENPYDIALNGTGGVEPTIISHPQSQTINYNTSASLEVEVSGTEPLSYQWYQGESGDTSKPVGTDVNEYPTPDLITTTSFWVRVSNTCGSIDSNTAMITVMPLLIMTDVDEVSVPEGGTAELKVKLSAQPLSDLSVAVEKISGDEDITLAPDIYLLFTPDNWNIWQTVVLEAAEDADCIDGEVVIQLRKTSGEDEISDEEIILVERDNDFGAISLDLNPFTGTWGNTINILVKISDNCDEISAFGFELIYDSTAFKFVEVREGKLTLDWIIGGNEIEPGKTIIGGYSGGSAAINPSSRGSIVEITLQVKCVTYEEETEIPIRIEKYTDDIAEYLPNPCESNFTFIPCQRLGDVSGEGEITPGDAQKAFEIYLGVLEPDLCQEASCDANCDGITSPGDARDILNHYLGKIVLPVCSAGDMELIGTTSERELARESWLIPDEPVIYPLDTITQSGMRVNVPVIISNPEGKGSFSFEVNYAPEALEFIGLKRSSLTDCFEYVRGIKEFEGLVRIEGKTQMPIAERDLGSLVVLEFIIKREISGELPIFIINPGESLLDVEIGEGTVMGMDTYSEETKQLSFGRAVYMPDGTVRIPILASTAFNMKAFGIDLRYPEEKMVFIGVERAALTEDFIVLEGNEPEGGIVRVGGFRMSGIQQREPGILFELVFFVREKGALVEIIKLVDDLQDFIIRENIIEIK